jgi:tRNA nucleotidyltransferase/poly(A) polymerase
MTGPVGRPAPVDPPAPIDPPAPVERPAPALPDPVRSLLERLWSAGHAAHVVGGALRDELLGRPGADWDVATDARPERILELFPGGTYQNRFGTVLADRVEVTTFRRDHAYGDHRRPDAVTFTDSIEEDLARRDFTINAIAWGRSGGSTDASWVDPADGLADLKARLVRAVGDPNARFDEDALRLVRAARIAAQLGFEIEPATRAQMQAHAADVRYLASERVGQELRKLLTARPPSSGLRILAETDLLAPLFPELAAQRGVPQDKIAGHDLWDHCLATLDAAADIAPGDEGLLLAALLHDTGKPDTFADGRFLGHDEAGARISLAFLARLGHPSRMATRVARLVRCHMFRYEPAWSDAAVRRFMRRVGVDLVDDLIALRAADNVGSGLPPEAGGLAELRSRVEQERMSRAPLSLRDLAVDGRDLLEALGRPPGPWVGLMLERLLESVVADPSRNRREILLNDARVWATDA